MTEGALAGLRVVEVGERIATAYCGKLLADLGAEVVKAEPPQGDGARRVGPFPADVPHPERSGLFLYLNTSKRGITLDLEYAAGRRLLDELLAKVDVLIEGLPYAKLERYGLVAERLRAGFPKLVVASISAFGRVGPHRAYEGRHLNIFHAGGEGYLLPGGRGWQLYPDRPPIAAGGDLSEYDAGSHAAIATLMALYGRGSDGEGAYLDVSAQDVQASLARQEIVRFPNEGFVETRATRALPFGSIMPARDGFVQVQPVEPHMWDGLMTWLGHPEWSRDERLRDHPSRLRHRDLAASRVAETIGERDADEVYHGAQAHGCAAGAVRSTADLFRSAHLRERGFFVEIDHPEAGRLTYPSAPHRFSATPWRAGRAPRLGEHNAEVYGGLLGYPKDDVVRLRQSGAI